MKIFQALAQAFHRENIACCFALLGDANMHWAGALHDLGTRFIYTRHEHAAVAAATALARATGDVGVATVTCGPGLTQVMTILPIAVRAKVPLVIFAGEAPLHKPWYNQGIDHAPFVEACGAEYRALHDPETMISQVHQAFADAKATRQPIVIGVPFDVQQQDHPDAAEHPTSATLYTPPAPKPPAAEQIIEAADAVMAAERPIVLAGLGAVDAAKGCIALAEKAGALLATTLPAKGLFLDQDFCLGVAGGYSTEGSKAIFAEADLVIAVGARLSSHTFDGGKLTPNATVIHIDIDPQTHVQGRKASDLQIVGDAELSTAALAGAVKAQTGWRTDTKRASAKAAIAIPDSGDTPDGLLHPMAVVKALAGIIPRDAHIINTSGHCAYFTAQMNDHPQDHYTVIREFGAIGNGTSFALGIAAAYPDRPVVLIDGDGSALMHIQELETMSRQDLPILTIVLNDGAYGSEVHKLRADHVSLAGSVFGRPDFAKVAAGFGHSGHSFTSLDGLQPAMNDFLATKRPALWDIHISDAVASPQILRAHKASHS